MADCNCGTSNVGKWFGKVGGQIGDRANAYGMEALKRFKGWSGLGDYTIHYNSLMTNGGGEPTSFSSRERGMVVRHRSYLGNVTTHPSVVGAFNMKSFTLNPGNVLTFPWLSPIALQFDQYRPRGIIFEFVSTASDTALTQVGSVMFSTNYDVLEPAPTSKTDMMQRAYSSEGKMSDNQVHGIECDPSELTQSLFYTRSYNSNAGGDAREYDQGTLYYATQGGSVAPGTIVGSLYVHFEYEFFKKQPYGGAWGKSMLYDTRMGFAAALPGVTNFFTTGLSVVPTAQGRPLGITFTTDVVTIPVEWAGTTFLFYFSLESNTPVEAVTAVTPTFTNCVPVTNALWPTQTGGFWSTHPINPATTSHTVGFELVVTVNEDSGQDATIDFATGIGNWPPTTTATDVYAEFRVQVVPRNFNALQ